MKRLLGAMLVGMLVLLALVLYLNFRGEGEIHDMPPLTPPSGDSVARGAHRESRSDAAWGNSAPALGEPAERRQRGSLGP